MAPREHLPAVELPKVPTGIDGLDQVTRGGLPKGRPTLVCGAAGCGKTLIAKAVANSLAKRVAEKTGLERTHLYRKLKQLGVDLSRGKRGAKAAVRMTARERQVVEAIAEGLSNKEIAQRLHVATHTVKSHVHNILEKLALHTRLEVAAYAHAGKGARVPA